MYLLSLPFSTRKYVKLGSTALAGKKSLKTAKFMTLSLEKKFYVDMKTVIKEGGQCPGKKKRVAGKLSLSCWNILLLST